MDVKCPNWSGFMQVVVTDGMYETSSIQILPFIKLDHTKLDTIYSALSFAQDQVTRKDSSTNGNRKLFAAVTFDQPLFANADDIV